jgi:hypothetical protein
VHGDEYEVPIALLKLARRLTSRWRFFALMAANCSNRRGARGLPF